MIPFSSTEWRRLTENAFLLPQEDGRVLVYPHAYLGAGYLIDGWQRAGYESWVSERRGAGAHGRRMVILAVVCGVPLLASFVLEQIAPGLLMIGFLLSFVAAGWAVLAVLQRRFQEAFPEARRARGRRPWGRIFKGLLVSRACHLWRCVLCFAVGLTMVVLPAVQRLPYWHIVAREAPDHLVFQLATLALWLAFTGLAGFLIVQHVRFRRRHHRAPRPEDLGTLL